MAQLLAFPGPEAKKPHWSGPAQCRLSPEHRWVAVVPRAANPWLLECPSGCGMTGHLIGAEPETPHEAKVWAEELYSARGARNAELEAEVARLEALIVEQGSSGVVTDEMYAEYARIRSKR